MLISTMPISLDMNELAVGAVQIMETGLKYYQVFTCQSNIIVFIICWLSLQKKLESQIQKCMWQKEDGKQDREEMVWSMPRLLCLHLNHVRFRKIQSILNCKNQLMKVYMNCSNHSVIWIESLEISVLGKFMLRIKMESCF